MLENMLKNDEIGSYLVDRTSLTKSQLDTLLISIFDNNNLDVKVLQRDKGKVSKGSFSRTLKQAKNNVENSLFTLIILEYFSIIDKNHIIDLIKIGNVLKKFSDNIPKGNNINTILDQISLTISDICNVKKTSNDI